MSRRRSWSPRPTRRSNVFRKKRRNNARPSRNEKTCTKASLLVNKSVLRQSRIARWPCSKRNRKRRGCVSWKRSIVRRLRRKNALPRSKFVRLSAWSVRLRKKRNVLRKSRNGSKSRTKGLKRSVSKRKQPSRPRTFAICRRERRKSARK